MDEFSLPSQVRGCRGRTHGGHSALRCKRTDSPFTSRWGALNKSLAMLGLVSTLYSKDKKISPEHGQGQAQLFGRGFCNSHKWKGMWFTIHSAVTGRTFTECQSLPPQPTLQHLVSARHHAHHLRHASLFNDLHSLEG